jgi:hypothetical protein
MTLENLKMMEVRLHVTPPSDYKGVLLAYPWPEFAGGSEFSLWDDAVLNVERTLEYRNGYGGAPAWPSDYVHIGDDDDACPYAMSCSDGTIVKTDHGNLTARPLSRYGSVETLVRELDEAMHNNR